MLDAIDLPITNYFTKTAGKGKPHWIFAAFLASACPKVHYVSRYGIAAVLLEAVKAGMCLTVDERSELLALHEENKQLRLEKTILKKAGAFFAPNMSQVLV